LSPLSPAVSTNGPTWKCGAVVRDFFPKLKSITSGRGNLIAGDLNSASYQVAQQERRGFVSDSPTLAVYVNDWDLARQAAIFIKEEKSQLRLASLVPADLRGSSYLIRS